MEALLVELLRAHPRGAEILLALVAIGAAVSFVNGLLPAKSKAHRYLGPIAAVLDRLAVATMKDSPGTWKTPGAASPPPAEDVPPSIVVNVSGTSGQTADEIVAEIEKAAKRGPTPRIPRHS
jgi:hypothetical protein